MTDASAPSLSGTTRDRFVAVAARLLDEGGLEAVTLREVGRRAGLSRAAPYRHFDSKEGLLAAIASHDLRLLRSDLDEAARKARKPIRAVARMLDVHVAQALDHPDRYRLRFSAQFKDREDAELSQAASDALETFVAATQRAIDAGELPQQDPRQLAALLIATAHGVAELTNSGHLERDKWGTDGAGVLRHLLAAIAPETTPARSAPGGRARSAPGRPSPIASGRQSASRRVPEDR